MGRRSISSTKTGKFMNPTDQARKEARRKELKKNKKQRLIVRQAVIKGKDPRIILTEMEALDKMEFDPNNPPPYNVKVIQDKRRKLKETWQKVYQLYEKEDPKQFADLKHIELDYEKRKSQLVSIYESVKQAEKIKLEDIPLPDAPLANPLLGILMPPEIPLPVQSAAVTTTTLPPSVTSQPKGILKTKSDSEIIIIKRKPPGPPSGPPPQLTEFECDDDEKEIKSNADESLKSKARKIRFTDDSAESSTTTTSQYPIQTPTNSYISPTVKPNATNLNYPPPKPTVSGSTYSQSSQSLASNYTQLPQQRGPIPTAEQIRRSIQQSQMASVASSQQSAAQQYYNAQSSRSTTSSSLAATSSDDKTPKASIIEAKPLLRNKIAELTRFVPTSLIVKREQKTKSTKDDHYSFIKPQQQQQHHLNSSLPSYMPTESKTQKPSTDSAYEAFMKEINKFL